MPTRRVIHAVLHNFLGTYTSRYSDHNGCWLFGQIVDKFERIEVELTSADGVESPDSLIAFTANLAVAKFSRHMRLSRLNPSYTREARLVISKLPGQVVGQVNAFLCTGCLLSFEVRALSDHGRLYNCEKRVFVAPHNPAWELRSNSEFAPIARS